MRFCCAASSCTLLWPESASCRCVSNHWYRPRHMAGRWVHHNVAWCGDDVPSLCPTSASQVPALQCGDDALVPLSLTGTPSAPSAARQRARRCGPPGGCRQGTRCRRRTRRRRRRGRSARRRCSPAQRRVARGGWSARSRCRRGSGKRSPPGTARAALLVPKNKYRYVRTS
jgi:hypothetical protein